MNRKSRTVVGILTATVLTGAGVATMANAVATAQPSAPAVSVETSSPPASPTGLPADQQRTEQLARSVDDLVAQIGVLEQAVAAGTPTPSPTLRSGRDGSTDDPTAEPEPEHTTAPPQVGTAPTDDLSDSHESESQEPEEPSDD
ncbi:hypothetical protein DDP54_06115 [Cellulomonas sp. WB94]|uniref:hypothetical protein n=1 Tax=Cellulomonas sp. WB94 TaxID=2173174 RepID=UPI000D5864BA|nr:hypothetical protein [Cellulomonas sp. WB94]PVU82650.1 hypothetical protein DDP54_06115 [Cellulomonas sp. WB94]